MTPMAMQSTQTNSAISAAAGRQFLENGFHRGYGEGLVDLLGCGLFELGRLAAGDHAVAVGILGALKRAAV